MSNFLQSVLVILGDFLYGLGKQWWMNDFCRWYSVENCKWCCSWYRCWRCHCHHFSRGESTWYSDTLILCCFFTHPLKNKHMDCKTRSFSLQLICCCIFLVIHFPRQISTILQINIEQWKKMYKKKRLIYKEHQTSKCTNKIQFRIGRNR